MNCPKCETAPLEAGLGAGGMELDRCGACGGVWLDKGELGAYIPDMSRFDAALTEALKTSRSDGRKCPRCAKELRAVIMSKALTEINICGDCSGLWLDKDEFAALKKAFG